MKGPLDIPIAEPNMDPDSAEETSEAREKPLSEANPKLINAKKSVPDDINSKEPTKFIAAKLDCTAAGLELEDKVIASTETTSGGKDGRSGKGY